MGYTPTVWINDQAPPIDQVNLNHIEQGIAAAALRVEDSNVVGASGATQTIPDVTLATVNRVTLTANCTFTFPAAAAGKSFVLSLVQGSGPFTAAWPATVKWADGAAPVLSAGNAAVDLFSFICMDGVHWLGLIVGQAFA